ncbi:hypothetical protein [Marinobacterium aestuariivivens]|uniref:Uncharacterized protein n=1 Tax=Marinobacterium aestuariivivens TaxID=1698799 RepID=A0ABW1ZTY7_9GAMM
MVTGQALRVTGISAKIESELLFAASFMAIAALALLSCDAAEQAARLLVGGKYRMGNAGFVCLAVDPALAQDPVTDKILIQADDEVFLFFAPAYYQGAFTLTQTGENIAVSKRGGLSAAIVHPWPTDVTAH